MVEKSENDQALPLLPLFAGFYRFLQERNNRRGAKTLRLVLQNSSLLLPCLPVR